MKKMHCIVLLLLVFAGCTKSTIKKNGCAMAPLTGTLCLPNIFSPNGDGINDVLYLRQSPGLSQIDTLQFLIKDGAGSIIFATTDPAVGWDGAFNGKIRAGVFQSEIKATMNSGEVIDFTGTVTCLTDYSKNYVVGNCTECRFDSQFNGHGDFDAALPTQEPGTICE